jgi:hypothetical protein
MKTTDRKKTPATGQTVAVYCRVNTARQITGPLPTSFADTQVTPLNRPTLGRKMSSLSLDPIVTSLFTHPPLHVRGKVIVVSSEDRISRNWPTLLKAVNQLESQGYRIFGQDGRRITFPKVHTLGRVSKARRARKHREIGSLAKQYEAMRTFVKNCAQSKGWKVCG